MSHKSNRYSVLAVFLLFLTSSCAQDRMHTQSNENSAAQASESLVVQTSVNPEANPDENQMALSSEDPEPQPDEGNSELDQKVTDFLNSNMRRWRDANVPYADGQLLHDIIVENNYQHAVEIGTSTGHSAIWIAWALSKTGGKLITIELNQGRHNQAKANFEEAGVAEYIDARLGNAHDLVPELDGPIDFVFCDADKEWYTNYFKALEPKLIDGACFTAHNTNQRGVREYISYVRSLSNFETTVDNRGSGMGITYKTEN